MASPKQYTLTACVLARMPAVMITVKGLPLTDAQWIEGVGGDWHFRAEPWVIYFGRHIITWGEFLAKESTWYKFMRLVLRNFTEGINE